MRWNDFYLAKPRHLNGLHTHIKLIPSPTMFNACSGAGSVCTMARLSMNARNSCTCTLYSWRTGLYALMKGKGDDRRLWTATLGTTMGFFTIELVNRNLSIDNVTLTYHGHYLHSRIYNELVEIQKALVESIESFPGSTYSPPGHHIPEEF